MQLRIQHIQGLLYPWASFPALKKCLRCFLALSCLEGGGFVIDPKVPCFLALVFSACACDSNTPPGDSSPSVPTGAPPPTAPRAKPRATDSDIIARFRLSLDVLRGELAEKGEIYRERSPDGNSSSSNRAPILITNKVRTRLYKALAPSPLRIRVTTRADHVTLTGQVENLERLQKAIVAVLSVPDVSALTSKVQVSAD